MTAVIKHLVAPTQRGA